jgi:hypothetical protein
MFMHIDSGYKSRRNRPMSQTHQQIAEQLVETFSQQLAEGGHDAVPQSLLAELSFQIRETLDAQSETIAGQLEQLAVSLRQGIDKSELGM